MADERLRVVTGPTAWSSFAFVGASFLIAFWGVAQVPPGEQIPIHWNAAGEADGFGSRWWMLLTPVIGLSVIWLLAVVARVEPRQANMEASLQPLRTLVVVLSGFFLLVSAMTTLAGVGRDVDVSAWLTVGIGILIMVIGNLLGKIRSTFTFGVRTPWTLSSDLSWQKTHRAMGFIWVVIGGATVVLGLAGQPEAGTWVLLGGLLASLVFALVYSYRIWRDDPDKREA